MKIFSIRIFPLSLRIISNALLVLKLTKLQFERVSQTNQMIFMNLNSHNKKVEGLSYYNSTNDCYDDGSLGATSGCVILPLPEAVALLLVILPPPALVILPPPALVILPPPALVILPPPALVILPPPALVILPPPAL